MIRNKFVFPDGESSVEMRLSDCFVAGLNINNLLSIGENTYVISQKHAFLDTEGYIFYLSYPEV